MRWIVTLKDGSRHVFGTERELEEFLRIEHDNKEKVEVRA